MYLGSWEIDDYLTFPCNTHAAATGAATDADAVPAYRVYEDETGTAILTGSMAKLDDANTVGFYTERIQLTAANGLEAGKTYTIYMSAAVSSITGTHSHTFQMAPASDGYQPSAAMKLLLSAMASKVSGGGTTTITFRDAADSKNRITATVDANGNRTAVTLDAT